MPLFRLTVLAQTFEKGDLGLNQHQTMMADVESNDEIGVLSQSFDRTICRLRNYIGEIADILERIANGDLNAQTTQDYVGDFASIQTSLNDILQRLNETMGQIVNSSKQVADGADQMSNVAQALSQGAMSRAPRWMNWPELCRWLLGISSKPPLTLSKRNSKRRIWGGV